MVVCYHLSSGWPVPAAAAAGCRRWLVGCRQTLWAVVVMGGWWCLGAVCGLWSGPAVVVGGGRAGPAAVAPHQKCRCWPLGNIRPLSRKIGLGAITKAAYRAGQKNISKNLAFVLDFFFSAAYIIVGSRAMVPAK